MTTLRVVVDQMVASVPGGIGRYTEELTREVIATAPRNCDVEGIISKVPDDRFAEVLASLPGLTRLERVALPRRELALAWQFGALTGSSRGMVHATSLLAPLRRIDRANTVGQQVAVTIHDVVPWTHPETLTPRGVAWHRSMARRARRYADAIVVPTHAVANQLREFIDFGDRVRVIGGAVSSSLAIPADADVRAKALGLPAEYLLTVGTLEPRKGLSALIAALARPGVPDIPLLIAGPKGWGEVDVDTVAREAGLAEGRVRTLGFLSDTDLALVMDRATAFVFPSIAEGFGLPVIEALHFGTPVIHSDSPALVEVASDAGITVARNDPDGYPERLAEAITRVLTDTELRANLAVRGLDRSRAFSWRDSAEKVWQLHADI